MAQECIKHQMPDGTIMDGPVHGEGQVCVEWANEYKKGGRIKNPRFKGKVKQTARQFSAGGFLVGPSHEEGGIQALVDGTEPIEVEGGEFIINKQTVDSVGEDFLHKLNSTQTTHHQGGFGEGILPSPSQYKDGGKVTRRNNMARGRRAPGRRPGRAPASKRMARGGRTVPSGRQRIRKKFNAGGRMGCGGAGQPACGGGTGYRRGGTTKPITTRRISNKRVTKYQAGGSPIGVPNTGCTMLTSVMDCNNAPSCNWNYSTSTCQ